MGTSPPFTPLACRLFLPPQLRRHPAGARAGGCGVGATAAGRGASSGGAAATSVSADADPRGRGKGGGGVHERVPAEASGGGGASGANWGVFVSGARGDPGGGRCVGAEFARERGGGDGEG